MELLEPAALPSTPFVKLTLQPALKVPLGSIIDDAIQQPLARPWPGHRPTTSDPEGRCKMKYRSCSEQPLHDTTCDEHCTQSKQCVARRQVVTCSAPGPAASAAHLPRCHCAFCCLPVELPCCQQGACTRSLSVYQIGNALAGCHTAIQAKPFPHNNNARNSRKCAWQIHSKSRAQPLVVLLPQHIRHAAIAPSAVC
jgi:hypothetical protein